MTSNDTSDGGAVPVFPCDDDGCPSHVVVVADADPAVVDDVADALEGRYIVRTATTDEELCDALADGVSAVLLDPTLSASDDVLDRLVDDADTRVAALLAGAGPVDERFDDCVRKPVSRSTLRATVDRLCHCVAYRDALDRCFDLAQRVASLSEDDPEYDRLRERLDELEAELDEAAAPLDSIDVYEAAFRGQ
ncbi:MAG: HalX domain-containing protein [Haloarculaceae archaeon]